MDNNVSPPLADIVATGRLIIPALPYDVERLGEVAPRRAGGLYSGQTNFGVFIVGREIGGPKHLIPDREHWREVAIEMLRVKRVMDAVEALIDNDFAQRADMDARRRVNEIGPEIQK